MPLTLMAGEETVIRIGKDITITVSDFKRRCCRLHITADRSVPITRETVDPKAGVAKSPRGR